jgi:serine/threonine protein kinase
MTKKRGKTNKKTRKRTIHVYKGGQSKLYNLDGNITTITDTYNGKPIFRKETMRKIELMITKKIMETPNPYIVSIYHVNDDKNTIDMELLDLDYELNDENIKKIQITVKEAIQYLHSINVMYIDWKYDNIGLSKDGKFKLFDFDSSGIADPSNQNWLIKNPNSKTTWSPPSSYSWAIALMNHITSPLCADNFLCFLFLNNMLDNIEHVAIYDEPAMIL